MCKTKNMGLDNASDLYEFYYEQSGIAYYESGANYEFVDEDEWRNAWTERKVSLASKQ